jgi:hypothetical protein
MTPRTFWLILIKIIGIYLILESILVSIQFVSSIYYIYIDKDHKGLTYLVIMGLIMAGLYFLILRYCVFRTELIVDKLHLDKGFEEEKFELKIHRSTVLSIAVIVIGGVLFIDALPMLCKQIFFYFQSAGPDKGVKENPASGWVIFYFVKLFTGLFMMTTSRLMVNFIERKRREPVNFTQTTD